MNSIILHFAVAASLLSTLGAVEVPPDASALPRASVTIPYSEIRALWEAAHEAKQKPAPQKPPISFIIREADAQLQLGEKSSALEVNFQIETFVDEWCAVPLIAGDVQLEKADAGANATIIWRDGYCLLTHQKGRSQVALRLKTAGWKADNVLSFKMKDAAMKRLRILGTPPGFVAKVDGQAVAAGADGVALNGEADEVAITLAAIEAERKAQPSQWRTEAQVLARNEEGMLRMRSKVFAHADSGSGLDLTLRLPASAGSVNVTGKDIANWTQSRPDERQRLVSIHFKTWDVLDRDLEVAFTAPQSPLAEKWIVPAPTSLDAGETRALFAVLLADGLELKGDAVRSGVSGQRLPQWMREEIGGASFITAESGAELALQPHWLPAVATAEATINEARAELRFVGDGSFQTSANFSIKHQTPIAWRLELPGNVEVLSCSVAGKSARPVQREKGVLELSLPAPEGNRGGTSVTLVYTGKAAALDAVSGKVALELARTPLFIDRLDWAIAIPDTFEITAVEGNARISSPPSGAAKNPNCIFLAKELCRGERPSVELFYQRRGLDQ